MPYLGLGVFLFILYGCLSTSQAAQPPTKIYLQTDKGRYFPGEDIWFRAITLDANYLNPSNLDTLLYVQLRPANPSIPTRSFLLPLREGFAEGHLNLDASLPHGIYFLCAFTPHSFDKSASTFGDFRTLILGNANYLNIRSPDLKVTAEGGSLIAGMTNLLVFWSTEDPSEHFEGIIREDDEPIAQITSNSSEIGTFFLTPLAGKRYTLENRKTGTRTALPPVKDAGIVLRKIKQDPNITSFMVTKSANFRIKTLKASIHLRGVPIGEMKREFTRDSLRITLPTETLPQGIVTLTLTDDSGQHLAERSVYINPATKLNVQVESLQKVYAPKGLVHLKIAVKDAQGLPVQALLSASVIDKALQSPLDKTDLLSYGYGAHASENTVEYHDLQMMLLERQMEAPKFTASLVNVLPGQIESKKGAIPYLVPVHAASGNISTPVPIGAHGNFSLEPDLLRLGHVYLKLIGDAETIRHVKWRMPDPFAPIEEAMKTIRFPHFTSSTEIPGLRGNILLQEVTIKGRGAPMKDPFLAQLDSMSKYEFNTDYVGKCNWLNCGDCVSGTKPVEGTRYARFRDGRVPRHGAFDSKDVLLDPYIYPKYTEEELIKKYNLFKIQGFPSTKEFYSPDYELEPRTLPDARTTLYWKPSFLTDEKGEAVVKFYTSDLSGTFVGKIEGITANGLLGHSEFTFEVKGSAED
jgi:hypothetical protein